MHEGEKRGYIERARVLKLERMFNASVHYPHSSTIQSPHGNGWSYVLIINAGHTGSNWQHRGSSDMYCITTIIVDNNNNNNNSG